MNQYTASTITEYLAILKDLNWSKNAWYRGHSLSTYKLEPSIFRGKKYVSNLMLRKGEKSRSITRPTNGYYEFMNHNIANRIMKKAYLTKNLSQIEIMFKNQHNGVPTRLLDFSSNPLIALFFCVENMEYWNEQHSTNLVNREINDTAEYTEYSGSVFLIDPLYTNVNTLSVNRIVETERDIKLAFSNGLPFALNPPAVDERIRVQKGKFICFGCKLDEYESYDIFRKKMIKIHIPNACKRNIMNELYLKRVTHSSIYPDIEGYAKEARYLMHEELIKRYEKEEK
jgi:hypothetical protein